MVSIKVPARICFFGDHQDYLGLPVIAGTIDRFICLKANPNQREIFDIQLLDTGKRLIVSLDDDLNKIKPNDYFRSVMAVLKQKGFQFDMGHDIEISGNIPINAGLSSSSALVVAWLRFLLSIQNEPVRVSDAQIGQWAYEAEVLYFNQPGGLMDQYTIAQGGLLFIDTQTGQSTPLNNNLGAVIVAESGISKETLEVLNNGRVYGQRAIATVQEAFPEFMMKNAVEADYERYVGAVPKEYRPYWYAAVHNYVITLKAKEELKKDTVDIGLLGELMNAHQDILHDKIKNTPPEMARMMDAARKAGALGAKTIGSGGGGCMVAIAEKKDEQKVIDAFLAAGALATYETKLTKI
ncbi:GHMP kinase [Allomuricauda sp. SCSIO 65647]|uniref:GHMP family kinase ATP-binding protein n=1 Tax=Allomuricauda sp. SCSIO 65647 TaxID=2908843 RepID=UPI001F2E0860|nr:GHMP kinase [Muricauda sp. SCSIO 65647]UJH68110.1 GHMP kinase [Muricauda sp. SCSIO 65647]